SNSIAPPDYCSTTLESTSATPAAARSRTCPKYPMSRHEPMRLLRRLRRRPPHLHHPGGKCSVASKPPAILAALQTMGLRLLYVHRCTTNVPAGTFRKSSIMCHLERSLAIGCINRKAK